MNKPLDRTHDELVAIVEQIQQLLFQDVNDEGTPFWNPDKQWDTETLEYVAAALVDAGLSPMKEVSGAYASRR
jgi:hypothetical protein